MLNVVEKTSVLTLRVTRHGSRFTVRSLPGVGAVRQLMSNFYCIAKLDLPSIMSRANGLLI